MIPDVNVLVAGFRSDHALHSDARGWLKGALAGCAAGGSLEILPMIATGFLRLVTHPRVFEEPTPTVDALAFMEGLLRMPGVTMPALGPEWGGLVQMCKGRSLRGNAIPDAWIAATVRALGGHLVTFDRDFLALLDRTELTVL